MGWTECITHIYIHIREMLELLLSVYGRALRQTSIQFMSTRGSNK